MDLLQVALIFLILLLSIFLAITGFQVFLILRDLKKALDKLNRVLQTGEEIGDKALGGIVKRDTKVKHKRFYKKVL